MAISTKPGAPVLIVHWTETKHHGEFSDTGALGGDHHGATTTKHRGILVEPLKMLAIDGDLDETNCEDLEEKKVMRLNKRGDFDGIISTIKPSTITNYRPGVIGADNLVAVNGPSDH